MLELAQLGFQSLRALAPSQCGCAPAPRAKIVILGDRRGVLQGVQHRAPRALTVEPAVHENHGRCLVRVVRCSEMQVSMRAGCGDRDDRRCGCQCCLNLRCHLSFS